MRKIHIICFEAEDFGSLLRFSETPLSHVSDSFTLMNSSDDVLSNEFIISHLLFGNK